MILMEHLLVNLIIVILYLWLNPSFLMYKKDTELIGADAKLVA